MLGFFILYSDKEYKNFTLVSSIIFSTDGNNTTRRQRIQDQWFFNELFNILFGTSLMVEHTKDVNLIMKAFIPTCFVSISYRP